nr:regulator [Kibdelosporangium sp. MJ126-NF4]CTQ92447.1 regulator [Kibdelosporangium sp. MJ126-NF4]
MRIGVLGPLLAADATGPIDLKGPRHRAVLARLLVARGRVVPVDMLVADLWEDPPDGAVGAIQTFVAALRKALEPDRPPRTPATLLVTEGPGYALKLAPDAVDAWRFEAALNGSLSALDEALALWRGPAYAEFTDQAWARAEITRLDELRLLAVERRAEALLGLGRAAEAVPDLQAHVDGQPLRESAWRLLALASTPLAARAMRWSRCAAPGACWRTSSASIPVPRCGNWNPTSWHTPHGSFRLPRPLYWSDGTRR